MLQCSRPALLMKRFAFDNGGVHLRINLNDAPGLQK
jgi:hypothetical protein